MRGKAKGRREDIAKDILNYLLQHPAAADTFDGIARWRVLDEVARSSIASTEEAMQWLIANEFLKEEKTAGGRSICRLNPEKRKEAESLVKGTVPKSPGRSRLSDKQ